MLNMIVLNILPPQIKENIEASLISRLAVIFGIFTGFVFICTVILFGVKFWLVSSTLDSPIDSEAALSENVEIVTFNSNVAGITEIQDQFRSYSNPLRAVISQITEDITIREVLISGEESTLLLKGKTLEKPSIFALRERLVGIEGIENVELSTDDLITANQILFTITADIREELYDL